MPVAALRANEIEGFGAQIIPDCIRRTPFPSDKQWVGLLPASRNEGAHVLGKRISA
jgi:hypothetical protein